MNNLIGIVTTVRSQGLRQAWKIHKWKLVVAIFLYYLVRDTIIYIVLPYLLISRL